MEALRFQGRWRHYQQLALEAFEAQQGAERARTHVVAPPGSGKTLIGLELARRIGAPALVLAPNTAVQAQWRAALAQFGADAGDAGLTVLTYQALCQLDDPSAALRTVAEARWAAETGLTGLLEGTAARRRDAQVARILAAVKREVARGEHPDLSLAELLGAGARERIEALRSAGVQTVVLDECHHLASMWGYAVRVALQALDASHVVGLTATPPEELTAVEAELYGELLGPVDFSVPTPAVVRDGFLAPFQELAWLCEPTPGERAWLDEHAVRFTELVTRLHDMEPGPLSFPEWVITRMRHRSGEGGEAEVPWERFQKTRPALARAGLRFLGSAGLPLPPGAPRGEAFRVAPDVEDWLVLLEDWALRCLAADPSMEAASRYDAVAAALRDLGFQLTRRGIRRGASEVDRLLTGSAAKPIGLVEVVALEMEARGDGLRALVLCDAELAAARPDESLVGVLDPGAGTAARAVAALAADLRTAPLRPLLVSGRGLQCGEADADAVMALFARELRAEPGAEGLVRIGGAWTVRDWVAAATAALTRGDVGVLVGTRALLGEGWDAPAVNCLVDLTVATTGVSVRQMRGRSLRLDPADPEKLASNWDVVCVAPGLARGSADYERFVRKHAHLFAPSEDGALEAGPSHVHPELGPFAPPPAEHFDEINRQMAARAKARDEARDRWRIGEPYAGAELATVVARPRAEGIPAAATPRTEPPAYPVSQRVPAAAGVAAAVAGFVAAGPFAAAAAVALAAMWAVARLRTARRRLPPVIPLDLAAHALAAAYGEAGLISPAAAASLQIEPRASGYLRAALSQATPAESARFAAGLDQVLSEVQAPRYLLSRLVAKPSGLGYLTRWYAVPDDLGARKETAEILERHWRRWLGPTRLQFTQRSDDARQTLATAASQAPDFDVSLRQVWV